VHNNYYFLRQLSSRLAQAISGFTLVSCFSQNKDELVMELNNEQKSFFIKASLLPDFSCVSFPEKFHRARQNSVDLFNETLLKKVKGVGQFHNERSFALHLEEGHSLLFKMHGHHANVILFQGDKAIRLFKNNLSHDFELKLSRMDRIIDWSRGAFDRCHGQWHQLYFTFGSRVWHYLEEKGFGKAVAGQQWELIQQVKTELENPVYRLVEQGDKLFFSLLPSGKVIKTWNDPLVAIHEFYNEFARHRALFAAKSALRNALTDRIRSGEAYIKKNETRLKELQHDQHYQQWADLLMAHLHEIKPGLDRITLPDFYTNQAVDIKLKPDLNAQDNAAVYYRKAKNRQIEIDILQKSIETKNKEIAECKRMIETIKAATQVKEIQKFKSQIQESSKPTVSLPYYECEHNGYKIWVGRNATGNDQLTFKHSFKEDLWLHAKDVSGSHVLIKHQAGKNFPKDVIERAAQLAAYNSKRKTESLCPVSYTPKKFVRKRKGDPAGMVVVEKEKVILVSPRL
jgi:predicted ribosome quality control (RQC) complex YloA/Tae2 family protein